MSRYYLAFDPGIPGDDYSAWCIMRWDGHHYTVIDTGLGDLVPGCSPFFTELPPPHGQSTS